MSGPLKVVTATTHNEKSGHYDPRSGNVGRMGSTKVSVGGVDGSSLPGVFHEGDKWAANNRAKTVLGRSQFTEIDDL